MVEEEDGEEEEEEEGKREESKNGGSTIRMLDLFNSCSDECDGRGRREEFELQFSSFSISTSAIQIMGRSASAREI